MPAIGFGLLWISYALGLWSWCLLTGRNVTLKQLVSPTTTFNWSGVTAGSVPPDQIMPDGIQSAPGGRNVSAAAAAIAAGAAAAAAAAKAGDFKKS